jgi:hypothetical protein
MITCAAASHHDDGLSILVYEAGTEHFQQRAEFLPLARPSFSAPYHPTQKGLWSFGHGLLARKLVLVTHRENLTSLAHFMGRGQSL